MTAVFGDFHGFCLVLCSKGHFEGIGGVIQAELGEIAWFCRRECRGAQVVQSGRKAFTSSVDTCFDCGEVSFHWFFSCCNIQCPFGEVTSKLLTSNISQENKSLSRKSLALFCSWLTESWSSVKSGASAEFMA